MLQEQQIDSLCQWFHPYLLVVIRQHHCPILGDGEPAEFDLMLQFVVVEAQTPYRFVASLALVVFIEHIVEDVIRCDEVEKRHARPDFQHIRKPKDIISRRMATIKQRLGNLTKVRTKHRMIQIGLGLLLAADAKEF